MDLRCLRDNLTRTIEGKRLLLKELERQKTIEYLTTGVSTTTSTICGFLDLNINELERILADLVLCQEATSDL